MTNEFYEKVSLTFLGKISKLKASLIKSLNAQIVQGKREEKRSNPTYSKTNFTPHAKKAQIEIDLDDMEVQLNSDAEIEEVSDNEKEVNQVIPQGEQQLREAIKKIKRISYGNLP